MIMLMSPCHCEVSDVPGPRDGLKWLQLERNRLLEWAVGETPGLGQRHNFFFTLGPKALPDIQD